MPIQIDRVERSLLGSVRERRPVLISQEPTVLHSEVAIGAFHFPWEHTYTATLSPGEDQVAVVHTQVVVGAGSASMVPEVAIFDLVGKHRNLLTVPRAIGRRRTNFELP